MAALLRRCLRGLDVLCLMAACSHKLPDHPGSLPAWAFCLATPAAKLSIAMVLPGTPTQGADFLLQLEETPAAQGYQDLELTGPAGIQAPETEYFQTEIRERGTNRKPNTLVVLLDEGIARLPVEPECRRRIDRDGLFQSCLGCDRPGNPRSATRWQHHPSLPRVRLPRRPQ